MGKVPAFLFSEVAGKVFILFGIAGEIIYKADFYLIFITIGSLLIAIGSELRPRYK